MRGGVAPAQMGGVFASDAEKKAVFEAELALDHRNYDRAWELAKAALAAFPESPEAIRTYISVAQRTLNTAESLERFERAPYDKLPWAGHFARAWAAVLGGSPRYALGEAAEAARKHGGDEFAFRHVELVAMRQSPDKGEAEVFAAYDDFIARYPDVGLAHLSYLNTFNFFQVRTGKHREAVERALKVEDSVPQIYLRAADLEEREFWFDAERGLEVVSEGLQRFPFSTELALKRIHYLRALGRTQEALDECQSWRRQAPNHGDFVNVEIDVLSDLGRFREAAKACEALGSLTYQPTYAERKDFRLGQILHYDNRPAEAIEVLTRFISERPMSPFADEARNLTTQLQGRRQGEKVHILPDGYYVQQRGNYCGPASVQMMLKALGIDKPQEDIAARVYTGIAGTPPQVIFHYARSLGLRAYEFRGDEAAWKRVLDAGHPILWLHMMGMRGAHYRVVTGYDDILKNWLVHDPNYPRRIEMPYHRMVDDWILPDLCRSIVLVPADAPEDPVLAGLESTPLLRVSNWVLYVATGANLFVGLFPAVLVNTVAAAVLAWLMALLLRAASYPADRLSVRWTVGAVLGLAVPLNLFIGIFRWSDAVSVLLGINLALLTMLPLLALLIAMRSMVYDYLHPRESAGLAAIVGAIWVTLSFVDRKPLEWVLPVAFFVVGLPAVLAPRFLMLRAEVSARLGDPRGALERVRRWGSGGHWYYAALCIELDALMAMGRFEEVAGLARQVRESGRWPRANAEALMLHELVARAAASPGDAAVRGDLRAFLAAPGRSRMATSIAAAALLYADPDSANPGEADAIIQAVLAMLPLPLPGVPRMRRFRAWAILPAAYLLALRGAEKQAAAKGDGARAARLRESWEARNGLAIRLLRDAQAATSPASR